MTLVLIKAMQIKGQTLDRDWIAFLFLTVVSDILLIAMAVGVFAEVP